MTQHPVNTVFCVAARSTLTPSFVGPPIVSTGSPMAGTTMLVFVCQGLSTEVFTTFASDVEGAYGNL